MIENAYSRSSMTKRYNSIWSHFRLQLFCGNNILHFLIMLLLYGFHIYRNISYNLFEIITVLQPSCSGKDLKSGENTGNCGGIRSLLNLMSERVLHPLGAGCVKGLCSLRTGAEVERFLRLTGLSAGGFGRSGGRFAAMSFIVSVTGYTFVSPVLHDEVR